MMIYENHIHSCTAYINAYNHHVNVTTAVGIIGKKGKNLVKIILRLQRYKKKEKDLLVGVRTDNHKKNDTKITTILIGP